MTNELPSRPVSVPAVPTGLLPKGIIGSYVDSSVKGKWFYKGPFLVYNRLLPNDTKFCHVETFDL